MARMEAIHAWGLVLGVAHAGGGQFGPHRFEHRAGFRGQQPGDFAHPVGLLVADAQVAAPDAVGVAQVPVLVEQHGQALGGHP